MEVFRAVMVTGTVAGAAELLHVSQPSVSKSLSLAERRTRLQLFERVKGRLVATPEAKRLYAEIEHLWTGVEKVRALTAELLQPVSSTLHIGASPSLGSALIPAALSALYRDISALRAQVDLLVPHMLVDAAVDHSIDLALALFPMDHPSLVQVARYECGWVCVMPPGHPLCAKEVVFPRDLPGYRLISFPPQPAYGVMPEVIFGSVYPKLNFGLEVRAGQTACLFSLAGAGISIVDELTVLGNVFPHLEVRPFRTKAKLAITIAHSAYRPLSRTARLFCDHIEATLADRDARKK